MRRLNNRAFELLSAEVTRLTQGALEEVRRDLVLRRLNRFRLQEGEPLTYEELRSAVEDIFPEFNDRILRRAARINRGRRGIGLGRIGAVTLGTAVTVSIAAGGLWVLNLPYPMIRWPVSRVAPILLLPSYISMDHSYRQTVSLVAQSDQLVNQATSTQDIQLGAEKVTDAQKHLDRLPVWFLGYYPRAYCTLFSCTWRFTYDEFAVAREAIGRMEAKIFQEENAFTLLDQGTTEVDAAKVQYQAAPTTEAKTTAVMAWQGGMDKLNEIPPETLAGRQAQTRLAAYRRDFEQVSGLLAGDNRSITLINAAKQFAMQAANTAQNAPHRAEIWVEIIGLWETAISRLEEVPIEDPGYSEAQAKLAEYGRNLATIRIRLAQEQEAQDYWLRAEERQIRLWESSRRLSSEAYAAELQLTVNELKRVEPGTTPYDDAQTLLRSVQAELAKATP
ncbi:hypothetical protein [Leptolyngbya sp. PCC 6406]|uniref:hypothetical protein n=1 Tax=Leptolyngbya sp. PCC 6406 TaxID=1173264 RepID=UPI0002AC35D0|nr:hypothetical protein [Leptolyngbya sp. PCC 6406]